MKNNFSIIDAMKAQIKAMQEIKPQLDDNGNLKCIGDVIIRDLKTNKIIYKNQDKVFKNLKRYKILL